MKRKLAHEALYSSEHYDSHHPVLPEKSDEVLIGAIQKLKSFDPNGSKDLVLLREIESQKN